MKTEKLKQNVKGYVQQFEDGGLRLLRKGQKGVIHAIFSRFGLVLILLLLQVGLLFSIFRWFGNLWPHYFGGSVVVTSAMVIYLLNSKMDNSAKITWMVVVAIAPVVGIPMFFYVKSNFGHNILRKRLLELEDQLRGWLPQSQKAMEQLKALEPGAASLAKYLYGRGGGFPVYQNTAMTYFPGGEAKFEELLRQLETAEEYIFVEYFIIDEGLMWGKILEVLARKALQGVDVRVIYDGVGSAATLPINYPDQLHARGILCRVFQPLLPVLSIHQNNRDHRKICVIDGVTGFVSGLNMADEYIDRKERFGYWKDNALRLRGEAVWSLTVFFLTMWDHQNPRSDFRLFRPRTLPPLNTTGGIVVPYTDTPNPADTVCADLHLQMITKAKRYLYLTTPYLAIDETITSALCTAARSGVDVRIMTPHIPDKKVVFAVTQSNYPVLLEAGARIYEFTPGFIHSKTVVADDLYASVGSCNLDYRSFYLQFENGVWLCGDPAVLSVRDDFLQTLEVCQEITLADCRTLPLFHRLLQSIYRLFAPLF